MSEQMPPQADRPADARSPSDVLRLVVAVGLWGLVLLVDVLVGSSLVGFSSDLLRGIDAVDPAVITTVATVTGVVALALLTAAAVTAVRTGGWRVLATAAVGAAVAAAAFAVADAAIGDAEPRLVALEGFAAESVGGGRAIDLGLALATAVLVTFAARVRRSHRRASWVALLGLGISHAAAAPLSAAPVAALASGWLGGSLALVLLGAPQMRPTVPAVMDGLRSVGVDLSSLRPASVDARGSTPYFGTTTGGTAVFVKVLGRDERSADLLFRLYRAVTPGHRSDERPFSSLRRSIEHEAFVALAAAGFGVRTPAVLAVADTGRDGFTLAYESVVGRSLDRIDPAELTDDVVSGLWSQIALLHQRRVAHRDLRLANVFLDDDGAIWIIDFGFAEVAASPELLANDLAELSAALSVHLSPPLVIAAARAAVGDDPLQDAAARLRPRYLSTATRSAVRAHPGVLEELQEHIAAGPAGWPPAGLTGEAEPARPSGSPPPGHGAR